MGIASYNAEQLADEKLKQFGNKPLYIPDIARLISDVPKRHREQVATLIIQKHNYSGKGGTFGRYGSTNFKN